MIQRLREPGDDGVPTSLYDDLSSYHENLILQGATRETEHASEMDALKAGYEDQLLARDNEIARLKAVNYDQLLQTAAPAEQDTETETETETQASGIDALFS